MLMIPAFRMMSQISFILLSNETEESLSRSREPPTTNTICHPYSLRVAFLLLFAAKLSISNYSYRYNITMNPARPDFKFLLETENSPHRTESVRAIISHGDARGRVQAAYHAGQALGSDHGLR